MGGKAAVDRMSEIDKVNLLDLNKQYDMAQQAILKGQADGTFDPIKNDVSKALQTKLGELSFRKQAIHSKYAGDLTKSDPLDYRKLSASEQSLRPKITGDMGADPKVIQREIAATTADLRKVTDPASTSKLQDYLADLQRQYANLLGTTRPPAPVTTPQAIAAGGVSAQPTAAPPVAAPTAPALAARGVAPQPPANPVEVAGVQVDQARAQLSALLNSPRPGLAAGRAAIDAYAAKVAGAKQMVAQAEAAYQSVLPRQGAAFMAQRRIAVP